MSAERAVQNPSRQRIIDVLTRAPDGATAFDLAGAMDLHHNAVRTHLSVLAGAGLVWSERERGTGRPGRPRIIFRLTDPGAAGMAASRRDLLDILLRLVARARVSEVEVEAIGVEEGRAIAECGGTLLDALQRTGFAPDDVTDAGTAARGGQEIILRHCPFAEVVSGEHGSMVCTLHKGIATGLLAATGGELVDFDAVGPHSGRCRVVVRHGAPVPDPDDAEA